jgi:hypothetical protein
MVQTRFLVSSLEFINSKPEHQHLDVAGDDVELPNVVQELASMVAVSGDHVEMIARAHNVGEQALM